jgi:predicted nucleic acid-binding protein
LRYLLDINVISEASKGEQADPNVVAWYEAMDPDSLCISALVIGEIRAAVERLRLRHAERAAAFERQLVLVIDLFSDRILGVDRRVAEQWGRLDAQQRRPAIDALIAATALVHQLVVVTRNVRDFAATGVEILNPFEAPPQRGGELS